MDEIRYLGVVSFLISCQLLLFVSVWTFFCMGSLQTCRFISPRFFPLLILLDFILFSFFTNNNHHGVNERPLTSVLCIEKCELPKLYQISVQIISVFDGPQKFKTHLEFNSKYRDKELILKDMTVMLLS